MLLMQVVSSLTYFSTKQLFHRTVLGLAHDYLKKIKLLCDRLHCIYACIQVEGECGKVSYHSEPDTVAKHQ